MSLKDKIESKIDFIWVGVVLGFLFPFLGYYSAMIFYNLGAYELWFILTLPDSEYFSDILIFILLPNMFMFWLFFFFFKADNAAKGLIASTLATFGFVFLSSY